ncbi:MAG: GNAT family N-acetyltransferase [Lachnospiraceae bacterium]|nr:GNAT family N-acetyltransferase [Lachnospiraceae bacterium]
MNFEYTTDRLVMRVCHDDMAEQVLDFYDKNREYFDCYEMTRADNFYTVPYQKATLKLEYDEMIKNKMIRFYLFKKDEVADIKKDYEVFKELDIVRKKMIGSVSLSQIRYGSYRDAMFGYKLDHDYEGNGYAFEACKKLMEIAFDELELHRLEAYIMPSNKRSINLIKKLGFSYEGIKRSSCEVNHVYEDHELYAFVKGMNKDEEVD